MIAFEIPPCNFTSIFSFQIEFIFKSKSIFDSQVSFIHYIKWKYTFWDPQFYKKINKYFIIFPVFFFYLSTVFRIPIHSFNLKVIILNVPYTVLSKYVKSGKYQAPLTYSCFLYLYIIQSPTELSNQNRK